MTDKRIECIEHNCRTIFIFTEKEQAFYRNKNLEEPKRCKSCREARKNRYTKEKLNESNAL
ncbi:MAG: zinc-ribbon domain containing protein [Candidatus Heimdallarchaeaceae archaeon]